MGNELSIYLLKLYSVSSFLLFASLCLSQSVTIFVFVFGFGDGPPFSLGHGIQKNFGGLGTGVASQGELGSLRGGEKSYRVCGQTYS